MKTIAIIQARMGATRLPGKMMMDIAGKPAVQHVVERVKLAQTIDEVWLATTVSPSDDALEEWARGFGVPVFRGNESDVLDRYYQTAKQAGADIVVRVTADCPLSDPAVIDIVVEVFKQGGFDYVSNVHPPTFPDGLDVECFTFAALERAWRVAKLPSEREHVTPYIWKHPELFRMMNYELGMMNLGTAVDLSCHRWTLDTAEDLELIRRIFGELENMRTKELKNPTDMQSVLRILDAHSDWLALNFCHKRNEGYAKSLAGDSAA